MKTYIIFFLASLNLVISQAAFAQNRAVTIEIGSIGGAIDNAAVRLARQVAGNAVANGTVGKYEVAVFPLGAPFPIEGGFSARAEAGYKVADGRFNAFVQELRTIKPRAGTVYNLKLSESCSNRVTPPLCESCGPIEPDPIACPQDAMICPDGSSVGRVGPNCEFAPCPAPR